ncbi:precorrin-2 dehydrogenase/sirohydrochlorin ferrochelatase family protein [Pedobacter nyackensis]|uniref:precorrin-2 dehydrogenase n=1 Tax=Pedobacter nyackensis TaxID=475255 RepID=A0A1W2DME2_9SPHI|nr:bifunctional precorrin-2 dehydrogenase/sirohydrochlorin ferrochelatase [Pedobacter nyackensis]SMC98641.1 precorrin-2 dehydrogenase / sirohydrochlorin ferrochelatase [Pedobacter nyackensis]
MEGNQLFPVFIKLNELHTLVIGAGPVGLEKLTALLNNSNHARITVVAETIIQEVRDLATRYPAVSILQKSFEPADLDGVNFVIAATNNNVLNEQVKLEANKRGLLVNVADKPELCDFYLGSVVQKGDLKIAISTNGKSPTIAKRLKEVLNDSLPNGLNITLKQMQILRNMLKGDFSSKVQRLNEVTEILMKPLDKE